MKQLTAVKFRLILSVLIVLIAAAIVAAFSFGYKYMQTVAEDTHKRQADSKASEDSVANLQRLKHELETRKEVTEKLHTLRSSNSLPQFDTEKSLMTITNQLRLPVKNVTFVDTSGATGAPTSTTSTPQTTPTTPTSGQQPSQKPAAAARNSRISFEFANPVSYSDLVRFLDAIETSTPKLKLDGLIIPSGSSRSSINPGVLTLELATS